MRRWMALPAAMLVLVLVIAGCGGGGSSSSSSESTEATETEPTETEPTETGEETEGTQEDASGSGKDIFFAATGVTDGELLRGVRYTPRRVLTHSLSMRSRSGAIRFIDGRHHPERSNLIRSGTADA